MPPAAAKAKALTVTGKSINGLVFDDLNGDGQYGWSAQHGVEPCLSHVIIEIYQDGGSLGKLEKSDLLRAQTKTDDNGIFRVEGLEAGYYLVVEHDPAYFSSVTANVIGIAYRPNMPGSADLQIFFADRQLDRSQLTQRLFFPNIH